MKEKWTLKDVGDFWDSVKDYDHINKNTYSYFRRFIDGYKLMKVKDDAYLLDICCRTGKGTLYFSIKKKSMLKAICMDPSKRFVDLAIIRLKKENINFKATQFQEFPLKINNVIIPNKTFDNIICFESLEHMPSPIKFLSELYRVLKDDGELLLTTPNLLWEPLHWLAEKTNLHHSEGPSSFLTRRKIIRLLRKTGFIIKKEKTTVFIPLGPKFLIKLGRYLENIISEPIKRIFCLRRMFVCKKIKKLT